MLNFAERTGCGAVIVVWSFLSKECGSNCAKLCCQKTSLIVNAYYVGLMIQRPRATRARHNGTFDWYTQPGNNIIRLIDGGLGSLLSNRRHSSDSLSSRALIMVLVVVIVAVVVAIVPKLVVHDDQDDDDNDTSVAAVIARQPDSGGSSSSG
jgi:hypothetical protein